MARICLYIAVLLALVLPGAVHAQEPAKLPQRPLPPGTTITARVDSEKVVIGDLFRYEVIVNGTLAVSQFQAPSFSSGGALELNSGPNTSVKMTYINGRSQQSTSYTFSLQARKLGEVTIPPMKLLINGVWYDSDPVTITIEDIQDVAGTLGEYLPARTNDPQVNQQLKDRYFATMEVPKDVYYRQAVPVKTYIYRDPNLPEFLQAELSKTVGGRDFIVPDAVNQQMANPRIRWESVQVGKKQMMRALVFTAYVVPTRTGELLLDPPAVRAYLPVQRRYTNDPFSNMFGSNQIAAEMPVRAQNLNVKPLPDKPAEAVAQIVGDNVTVELTADREKLLKRELLTLEISIVGEGFFDLLSQPELPDFNNLSRIDTNSSSRAGLQSGSLVGEKKFEYVYQALDPGEIEVPPIKFALFNPSTGQQSVVETTMRAVKILPDNSSAVQIGGTSVDGVASARTAEKAQARELGRDVAYIDTSPLTLAAVDNSAPFFTKPWFWLLQLLPVALAFGYGLLSVRQRGENVESQATRSKRGRRAAENALREANRKIGTEDKSEFYATLSAGMMEYIASIIGRSGKGLTMEEASAELSRRGVDSDTIAGLEEVLKKCDSIRFSPTADTAEERRAVLSTAETSIANLADGRK